MLSIHKINIFTYSHMFIYSSFIIITTLLPTPTKKSFSAYILMIVIHEKSNIYINSENLEKYATYASSSCRSKWKLFDAMHNVTWMKYVYKTLNKRILDYATKYAFQEALDYKIKCKYEIKCHWKRWILYEWNICYKLYIMLNYTYALFVLYTLYMYRNACISDIRVHILVKLHIKLYISLFIWMRFE